MNATELIEKIEAGELWSECHGPSCSNEMHEDCTQTYDGDELPAQLLTSKYDTDAVFCSGKCRREFEAREREAARRKRRVIGLAIRYFGPHARIKYAFGESRSGWCKCDLGKLGTDYPGCVDVILPGLKCDVTGCPRCRQFGVAKMDTEAYHEFMRARKEQR